MRYKYVVTLGSWLQPVQSISDINIMSVNTIMQVNIETKASSYSALNAFLFCKLICHECTNNIKAKVSDLFSQTKCSQIFLVTSGASVLGAGLAPGYGGPAPEYPELNCTLLQVLTSLSGLSPKSF